MRFERASLPIDRSLLRQWFKVWGPKTKLGFRCYLLGGDLVELWTHYCQAIRRTQPCIGEEDCSHCKASLPRRYKCYLPALMESTREKFVLELTEGASRALQSSQYFVQGIRGISLKVFRKREGKNAPVMLEINRINSPEKLPGSFDVLPSLEKLWEQRVKKYEEYSEEEGQAIFVAERQIEIDSAESMEG